MKDNAKPFKSAKTSCKRADKADKPYKSDKPYGANRTDRPYKSDKPYGANRTDRPYKSDKPYGANRTDRPYKSDKPYEANRTDRPYKSDKPYGANRTDRPYKSDKPYGANRRDDNNGRFGQNKKFNGEYKSDRNFRKNDYKTETKPTYFAEDKERVEEVQENSGMTFGRNAVIELLKSGKTVDKIFVQSGQREGSITMIVAEAMRNSIPVVETERTKLDKMINGTAHQGVVAFASEVEYCSVDDILAVAKEKNEKPFILIADKIMDAQNLGAIIRTAECAGVHGIIISKRRAVGISSIVNKVSAGAVFHIKIAKVANIATTVEELKKSGVWICSSTLDITDAKDAQNDINNSSKDTKKEVMDYTKADYNLPLCLVVGNEGEGLSPIIIQKSDFLINIPMFGKIESLNVSCAAAVLLYEAARQRNLHNQ